jgi:hypothetical protein
MKYIYSFVPFEHEYLSNTYKFDNNFINLAKASISRVKDFGKIIIYTREDLIPFFIENINKDIIYKKINFSKTFHWYKARYLSILNEIELDDEPLVHIDFDMFFIRNCFTTKDDIPDLCLSHGEPHNILGQKILTDKKIVQSYILKFYDETFNFLKNQNFPEEIINMNVNFSYNTGIFGGKNLNLIKNICEKLLNLERKYNDLYLNIISKINLEKINQSTLLFAVIMDQSFIAYLFEKELKIQPKFIENEQKSNLLHFASDAKTSLIFKDKLNYFCQYYINDSSFDIKKYFYGTY